MKISGLDVRDKKARTTAAHFQFFKKCVEKWIKEFGLKDWHVVVLHEEWEHEEEGVKVARTEGDLASRTANTYLNKNWGTLAPSNVLLDQVAYHEVVHILLHRLAILAISRAITQETIAFEIEAVIRRFENSHWKAVGQK